MKKTAGFFHVRCVWLTVVVFYLAFFVSKQKPERFGSDFFKGCDLKGLSQLCKLFCKIQQL